MVIFSKNLKDLASLKAFALALVLVSQLASISLTYAATTPPTTPTAPVVSQRSYDYPRIFDYAIKLLTREPVRLFMREVFKEELLIDKEALRKQLKLNKKQFATLEIPDSVKDISQSQMVMLLHENGNALDEVGEYLKKVEDGKLDEGKLSPDELKAAKEYYKNLFRKFIDRPEIKAKFAKLNNPAHTMALEHPNGAPGITDIATYANHVSVRGRTTDLKQVLLDFIRSAEGQIAYNFFDSGLLEVADALIEKALEGKEVYFGIDASVVETKPDAQAFVAKLKKHNKDHPDKQIDITLVESSGYDHQKMAVKDWKIKGKGEVLTSSGNATASCIDPKGDPVPTNVKPGQENIPKPNANNTTVFKGDLFAQFAWQMELYKTLVLKLKGASYPLSGIFKFYLRNSSGNKEDNFALFSSSPRGGLTGDLNIDFYAHALMRSQGPIRGAQYSASSKYLALSILYYIEKEIKAGRKPVFKSVSDTTATMREWSLFLRLSGFRLYKGKDKNTYVKIGRSQFARRLTETEFQTMKDNIRVSPPEYGNRKVALLDGTWFDVNAKIHHKIWIFGEGKDAVAFIGVSANSSEGSNINTEQVIMVKDLAVTDDGIVIFEDLHGRAEVSVEKLAELRNSQGGPTDPIDPEEPAPKKSKKAEVALPSPLACDPMKKL